MEEYEKIYFDEFQHSIIDLGEKVAITNLSDKYERPITEISSALEKWTEIQKDKKLKKEYILRGIHKDGFPLITIVPEDKLEKAKESVKSTYKFLYSAEVSSSSPSLNINKLSALKTKNLAIPAGVLQRKEVEAKEAPKQGEPLNVVKAEPNSSASNKKSANDFFKNTNPDKKDNSKRKIETKNEIISKPEISPKKEKTSPETKHDIKPVVNKKATPVKGKTGKGSIASFFSAKPISKTEQKSSNCVQNKSLDKNATDKSDNNKDANKSENKYHNNEETKTINKTKQSDKLCPGNENKKVVKDPAEKENISKKRPLDDSETKKQEKHPKKQKTVSAGRRRIFVDSSDEENVTEEPEPEPDPECEPVDETVQVVEIEDEKEEIESVETKPLAALTYQDEDGFLVTIKEKKPPPKKVTDPAPGKKTPAKKTHSKIEKMSLNEAAKQRSIRNFFIKK